MKANRCRGCHEDIKRKLLKKEAPLVIEEYDPNDPLGDM
ncbi:hypothetical protein VPHD148_0222 [Vibrio phage D148]